MASFQKGDVVQLKSGGPKMTVSDPNWDEGRVACDWFDGSEKKSDVFAGESLELAGD